MIESIKNYPDINVENIENWFNFNNSLSQIEKEFSDLPEWFEYDSNGCIICRNQTFTDEDYVKEETPIDRILWNRMKEWESFYVDYSDSDGDIPRKIKHLFWSVAFLIKKEKWHIKPIDVKGDIFSVPIIEWMKIAIGTNKYVEYINNIPNQPNEERDNIDHRSFIIKNFLSSWVWIDDIKNLFGNNINDDFIFDTIKNYDNYIDEENKIKIFGKEYADKIGNVSVLSWLQWFKLKNKLGSQFIQYLSKFVLQVDRFDNEENLSYFKYMCFKSSELTKYLLYPRCKITIDNIDEYINMICEIHIADIGVYTPKEIKEIIELPLTDINLDDDMLLEKIRYFKSNWITKEMDFFASGTFHSKNIEELFINEQEWKNLFYFLFKYPQKLSNLWWKKIQEIDLNTKQRNFCFRGILEMIKSRWDMNVLPYPWKNASQNEINDWKKSWEHIIKEYENLLRNYIWLDFYIDDKWERIEKDRKDTFDKIFYSMAIPEEDWNWAFRGSFKKDQLQSFSKNNVLDYSSTIDENWKLDQTNQKKLIDDLCLYAQQHPNEKILVYIWAHGLENWESWNWWTKEDWLKISKYPNVKVMSTRCYFGNVYNSEKNESWDYIYDQFSQLSWFSNKTTGNNLWDDGFIQWYYEWLWFHEMELYARLNYQIISPLTESVEFENRITWGKERKNIWLAYGDEWGVFENNA